MSLDLAILGDDGAPTLSAALGVAAHVELITVATKQEAIQVLRMHEYYEDVAFDEAEARALRFELENMRSSLSPETMNEVDGMLRLLREAQSRCVGVLAIAD